MYPILEKNNIDSSDFMEYVKMAMPFVWSFLGTSSNVTRTFTEGEQVFFPLTNSQVFFSSPLNYALTPIRNKDSNFDGKDLAFDKPTLHAGYFLGIEGKEVKGSICEPDTMLVDTVNSIYFSLRRNDFNTVGAILQAVKQLQTLYSVPIVAPPKVNITADKRVRPYEL